MLRLIEAVQSDSTFDVRLVPVAVYWGRAPQKEGSWLRLLLAESWRLGGPLRKFFQVLFNGRFVMLEVGEPRKLARLARVAGVARRGCDGSPAARIVRLQRSTFRSPARRAHLVPIDRIAARSADGRAAHARRAGGRRRRATRAPKITP
jgi:glycerol-3-phosphate O-acyltransferase